MQSLPRPDGETKPALHVQLAMPGEPTAHLEELPHPPLLVAQGLAGTQLDPVLVRETYPALHVQATESTNAQTELLPQPPLLARQRFVEMQSVPYPVGE